MNRKRLLSIYFRIFGILNIFVISFAVPIFFGNQFLWHPRNPPTEMMMSVIYFAMGIIMILCAKNPLRHKSFLDFMIIANLLHAIVMAIYAENLFHIIIDTLSIGAMGLIPLFFYPWGIKNFLKDLPLKE